MSRIIGTVALLVLSNIFMTAAWYGHLKWFGEGKRFALSVLAIIGVSWLIALPEYCLQVPANRMGHVSNGGPFSAPQLKIIQEAVTLIVFTVFSLLVLKEKLRLTDGIAFGLVFLAVVVSASGRLNSKEGAHEPAPAAIEETSR